MRPLYLLACLSVGLLAAAAQAGTVYSNDFETSDTTGWSVSTGSVTVSATPGGTHGVTNYLGQLGQETATLNLSGLAAHSTVTISFDLYIIQSMDGNGPLGGGADPWSLNVDGTSTLIATNFANYPGDTQDFGGPNGSGYLTATTGGTSNYAPQFDATEANTLGFQFNGGDMDAVYHLSFTFSSSDPTLMFNFVGDQNQAIGDEGWGLDNVTVSTDASTDSGSPTPLPASVTSGLALLGGLGAMAVIRRRRKLLAAG